MEQVLAVLVLTAFAGWALGLVRQRAFAESQAAAQAAEARRIERQQAADRAFALAKARIQAGHPLGGLAWLPPDAKVSLTVPPIRDSAPAPLPASATIVDVPAPALPGVTTLGQTLGQGWHPTPDAILLGLGPGGERITVPVGDMLCHVVTAGKTGSGKSNILRLLLTQLAAIGAEYYICDPHFAPVNPKTREDWRALAAASQPGRALTDKAEIVALVDALGVEVEARLARWHRSLDPGPARFYLFEELPSLAEADRDFMKKLGRLLREGRKLGLFVITAAQDMLISTVGGSAGLRSQFATVYYGGGDPYTARALLATKVTEPPGKGVVWLRSVTDNEPRQARVPLVLNEDITALVQWRGETGETGRNGDRGRVIEGHFTPMGPTPNPVSPVSDRPTVVPETGTETGSDPAKRVAVLAGLRAMEKYGDLIERVWGVKAGSAQGYKDAYAEFQRILADLAKGA